MTTKEEAFQQYEEELARIDLQAYEAREKARETLHEQLAILRAGHHAELKEIRGISQRIKK